MGGDIKDTLRLLREKYALQLPDKIRQLDESLAECLAGSDDFADVIRMAHTLSGSSSSFGFTALGRSLKALETALKDASNKGPLSGADSSNILSIVDDIKRIRSRGPDHEECPVSSGAVPRPPKAGKKLVFIAEDDAMLAEGIAAQLGCFGFEIRVFSSPWLLIEALSGGPPSAVIMDIEFPGNPAAGIEAASIIKARHQQTPIVFVSSHGELEARIGAARAGADAYLLKPFAIGSLVEKLEALTAEARDSEPYRILIVDDDPDLSAYFSLILGDASMRTHTVNNPMNVMPALVDFNPDLILMDMYMPHCTGIELAKAIRQIESFVSIPIVFLSSETDIDKQLTALSTGGDDFLTKPIEPKHLISSVGTRAERMRIIRSFMDRDSLTGLLNHSKTKEHLDVFIERARRQHGTLSFAMVDIDRFKDVNDTYGHHTGDAVIMGLSRLLQQRLRKTDVLGRYGGEEFALILPDTDLIAAEAILNGIRESYCRVKHRSKDGEFTSTFSCGIASFPDFADSKSLLVAADNALYEAKRSGRNRVIVSRPETGKK